MGSVEHPDQELISTVERIREQHYPESTVIFLSGSMVRREGKRPSDLDLVVIYRQLEYAYRESFHFERWPVEAFVHDAATLEYFFLERDRPTGVPSLMTMVSEGVWPFPNHPTFRAIASRFESAFRQLFEQREVAPVVRLAEQLLAPCGGRLFDGYRLSAPEEWKTS